ncbi:organic cation transporter protein isoform X4 [Octopus bimaculoides]|uniref:organic cation transporter protein isoform X4 n=1 Tax=Octopus bimaculoides TaxID=37653 RepID=UPI00071CD48C|nr:organic cation transporter protein isoform X4 [Octopus bimaculoides]|eukprot:XP_014770435.1 PREDICTED: organic cation transporter protein-like isoform X3 [Octopus bimaculoides]
MNENKDKMKSSQIDVDGLMHALGHTKYFHTTQFILISGSIIIASTNSFLYMFYALTPEYQCNNLTEFQFNQYNISINETSVIYDKCSIDIINTDEGLATKNRTLDCVNGYYYTTPVDKSIVSQWDLVCNSVGLAESTQTVYTLGQVISGLLAPCLIEKFGRKPTRVSSHALLLVFNLIAAFSPSYWLFTIMRFLIGGAREAYTLSTAVLLSELYPKEKRIIMFCLYMNIWAIYNCVLGYIAYILKDYSWNVSFLFNAVLSGYFILDFFFLKESLRWLFANSKVKAAEKIVKKAAKQNRVDFDKVWRITLTDSSRPATDGHVNETSLECRNSKPHTEIDGKIVADQSQIQTGKGTSHFVKLLAIFKSSYLRKITIIISIEIIVNVASLNSVLQMLEVLTGSIYLNYSVATAVEIGTVALYAVMAKRFGHKIALQFWKTFAAVCIMSTSLTKIFAEKDNTTEYIILVLYILAFAGLVACASGDTIYISELYPTQIRSVGSGFATTSMRIVCLATPFLKLLVFISRLWLPLGLLGLSLEPDV